MSLADIADFIFRNGAFVAFAIYMFWAIFVSNPPKYVPFMFYQKALDRIKELERKLDKADEQAARAVTVTGEAVKADKSVRAGSKGAATPERRADP